MGVSLSASDVLRNGFPVKLFFIVILFDDFNRSKFGLAVAKWKKTIAAGFQGLFEGENCC
jgi:hypothetical protein